MKNKYNLFLLIVFLVFCVCSCGESETSNFSQTDTGSINVTVKWVGAPTIPETENTVSRAQLDCDASGIVIVSFEVLDEGYSQIGNKEFNCSAHDGTIGNIKPGLHRTLIIRGLDSGRNVIYRGERIDITVSSGKTHSLGEVDCFPVNCTDADSDGYYVESRCGDDVDCDDADTDEHPGQTWYVDSDTDGYGNNLVSQTTCERPSNYVLNNTDCDDSDIDERPGQIWYLDADGDGYSDETTDTSNCTRPADYYVSSELTSTTGDCNDDDAAVYPGATELCDGNDNQCPGDSGYGSVDEGCTTPTGMALIPSGCFDMGDAFNEGNSEELPVHDVCVTSDFYMDIHEVTNAEYTACVSASGCTAPSDSSSSTRGSYYGNPTYDDFPVIYVSWNQANDYCTWAGKRLPTEAEWEYAARGGLSGKRYPWGDTISGTDANYYNSGDSWDNDTSPVENYAANGYGLYDMAGNVWEWVNDWYQSDYYSESPTNDPPGSASGLYRVQRGGGWDNDTFTLRVAFRASNPPTNQDYNVGIRCAGDVASQTCTDSDSDTYYAESGCGTAVDCDDGNATIYPGALEICDDGMDQDCSGSDAGCTSLVAYYPLNGNANDESGNGYDGIIFGATLTTDRAGNSNGAYSFDGVDDYIKLPQSLLDITANNFSYSIWFDSNYGQLINLGTNAVSGSLHRKTGHVKLRDNLLSHMGIGSSDPSQTENVVALADLPVFDQNGYNHLVFVRTGNLHQVYVNGVHIPELDITVSGESLLLDDILVVGKHLYSGASNYFLDGKIDEIRFYDQALSTTVIRLLYEADYANSLSMTFKLIPSGIFTMGSPDGVLEYPIGSGNTPVEELGRDTDETPHEVTLTKSFYMMSTEVTQGQWEAVMGSKPSNFSSCGSDCSVEMVSWNDVQEFIDSLNAMGEGNYRLPTEAEWEYAARAGSTTAFVNGDITVTDCSYDPNLDSMGWYCFNANSTTQPAAQKQANAWGIYDMHGNVWEWCQDWHDPYPSSSVTDPTGSTSGSIRVQRGGSWGTYARFCRSAHRDHAYPDARGNRVGFRLVREYNGPDPYPVGASFDWLVVFGDSYSDNGNLYAMDNTQVPSATYWQGRFSNGPVWGEYLTDVDLLDCTLVDNAYAGAQTSGTTPPGVVQQVAAYTGAATLPDNALFVIWIGANDFLGGGTDYVTSVDNIETALDALAVYGVENILILNLPDLGATPRMLALGGPSAAGATVLAQAFNAELAGAVDDFIVDNPGITVYEMDIYSLFEDIVADPSLYGLTNVTDVSPNFLVADNFDNSTGYAFWDDVHPTTETHEEIALEVYQLLVN